MIGPSAIFAFFPEAIQKRYKAIAKGDKAGVPTVDTHKLAACLLKRYR